MYFGDMQWDEWDFEEICVRKYEKWAKLVRTCSRIFLPNLLRFRLSVLLDKGKKGCDHRTSPTVRLLSSSGQL